MSKNDQGADMRQEKLSNKNGDTEVSALSHFLPPTLTSSASFPLVDVHP